MKDFEDKALLIQKEIYKLREASLLKELELQTLKKQISTPFIKNEVGKDTYFKRDTTFIYYSYSKKAPML